MSEKDVIQQTPSPLYRGVLAQQLQAIGVQNGHHLLVHTALSSMGWVIGGGQALLEALQDVVGESGTIVIPTQTGNNTDPAYWQHPPVPEAWWPIVRKQMPAYDPQRTPTRGMGRLPELFRTWPNVYRSDHPQHSFAAWGASAQAIVGGQTPINNGFGEQSPLARLYERDSYVLLIGVGYDSATALHLAESRTDAPLSTEKQGASVMVNGEAHWVAFEQIAWDTEDFDQIGNAFEQAHPQHAKIGKLGNAETRLLHLPSLVDFAVQWMNENRR